MDGKTLETKVVEYDDKTPAQFMLASIIWALVGMGAGLLAALQLNWWGMNGKFLEFITFGMFQSEGVEYITFGRLRPLHTNAAIFAFVGNMMFAGIYYSTQRLCKARTASDILSKIHMWGWQLIIVGAALTIPAGLTRGKEYAELIWPINIAVALIWVVFAVNFFWTLAKRNEPSLYVAIWFYIATIVTVAVLYIVNHLSIPTGLLHSYTIYGGVQDALVQWWYGHNAVAFFLTTPILGIMYYYLPKAVNRPVYSYRLSVVHFWALVFIYIWAGPHHLLNTSLPRWLQMLGMLFSLMLWAPSWGGMLNGLLTLRGAWHKLRTDPVIKFFVAGVTFYGMATFEGPLLSIRAVNTLSHYSDWTIGHVHSGTLGWNGFMAAGMFYWMAPRLWRTKLHSEALANMHFWIGLTGILFYVGSMWVSGVTQGLMLNATINESTTLKHPEFVETLTAIRPMMWFRVFGGTLYLIGFFMLAYNIARTIWGKQVVNAEVTVTVEHTPIQDRMSWTETILNAPVLYSIGTMAGIALWFFLPAGYNTVAMFMTALFAVMAVYGFKKSGRNWGYWYDRLIENWLPFTVLVVVAILIGGFMQIIPTLAVNRAQNVEDRLQVVLTPLELAGRDIYVAEGCYNCHSQMIRTLVPDVLRYGDYSRLGESIYDYPFQWGSKRTGPDLAREGGPIAEGYKYMRIGLRPNSWHYRHMLDPRSTSEGSNMPAYPWLFEKKTDLKALPSKISVLTKLGVPYPAMSPNEIRDKALFQGQEIVKDLKKDGLFITEDKQIVALIAYLQKLGAYELKEHAKADDAEGKKKPWQPESKMGMPDDAKIPKDAF